MKTEQEIRELIAKLSVELLAAEKERAKEAASDFVWTVTVMKLQLKIKTLMEVLD
jgi:hypothetical protein